MVKIYLFENYQNNKSGEIIDVSNNVAFGLVDNGKARYTEPSDFVSKVKLGETKAFSSPPEEKASVFGKKGQKFNRKFKN